LFQQIIPFVGRENEVSNILRMLNNPDCRLLTLIGPGGMGKTRLALRITELVTDRFTGGYVWVDLQPLLSEALLIPAIVDALGLAPSGDLVTQVAHYLRHKHLLLILDNFEHLLERAAQLTTLLGAAPDVKMLVTSREALNLREEWVHHLDGLPYPPAIEVKNVESSTRRSYSL
jgi:predicted ATPase